jgi:hypothetical protein
MILLKNENFNFNKPTKNFEKHKNAGDENARNYSMSRNEIDPFQQFFLQ